MGKRERQIEREREKGAEKEKRRERELLKSISGMKHGDVSY